MGKNAGICNRAGRGLSIAWFAAILAAQVLFGQDSQAVTLAAVGGKFQFQKDGDVADAEYPFQKGTAFKIAVFPDTVHFLNGIHDVDDQGNAFLPIVGTVRVDGLTQKALTAKLDTIYLPFLRYPTLRVQPLIRISLLGGFIRPGLYYVSPDASLWDAIEMAGGPVREDGLKLIKWERSGAILKQDLVNEIQAGTSLSAMGLRSGDQLWVTHELKRGAWDIMATGIVPILSLAVTALSAFATLYFTYATYQGRK